MDADEYQKAALVTANRHYKNLDLPSALSLAGESGEYCDLIKKINFHDPSQEKEDELRSKIKNELGDIAWSLALSCHVNGLTLSEVMEANIHKLKERHGDKYSPDYLEKK